MSDGIFSSFRVSAMGLKAQRVRLDVAAENLANVETTRTGNGDEPYRAKRVVLQSTPSAVAGGAKRGPVSFQQLLSTAEGHMSGGGASSVPSGAQMGNRLPVPAQLNALIAEVSEPFISEFDPDHPDADETGVVLKPNVDPIAEMMNLIKATRAYEANATALDAAKDMLNRALEI